MMNNSPYTFTQRVLIAVGITTTVVVLLLFLWFAIDVFLLAFAAVLLAIFLRGLGNWISKYLPLSEGWSFALVTIALVCVIAFGVWLLAPSVANQIEELENSLPQSIEQLTQRIEGYSWGRQLLAQFPNLEELLSNRDNVLTHITAFFSTTFGVLADFIIIIFVGLQIGANPQVYERGIVRLVPVSHRPRAREVLNEVGHTLKRWMIGRIISMVAVWVLTAVGLWLLGVPLVLTLATLAGLLGFIPNIGPILAAVPAVLLAFLQSPMIALYVILLYVGIQTIEGYFLTPLVQEQMVSLPAALTILVQVLLGLLLGGLALVLATPLTAAVVVLVRMLYIEDTLHDPSGTSAGDG